MDIDAKALKPHRNKVLVERDDPERLSKGGIIIPDSAGGGRIKTGTVLAVGEGKINKKGVVVPMPVKPGDRICWDGMNGAEFKQGGTNKTYFIMEAGNIEGILEE